MAKYVTDSEYSGTTLVEAATIDGRRCYCEYDRQFAAGEEQFILYNLPLGSDKVVALQNRTFKTETNVAELEILWDSTGFNIGAAVPIFNENNFYRNRNPQFVVNEIDTPSNLGVVRETDFTGSGGFFTSSGGISPSLGARFYNEGTFFIARVINGGAAQRIKLTYTWLELAKGLFRT
jgi:hypothetical protein